MAVVSANRSGTQPDQVTHGRLSADLSQCPLCQGLHSATDHQRFMVDMPQDPIALTDDLVKMGLYKPQALSLADRLTQAELREALFLQHAAQRNPARERLCRDLIKLAGGLDEAFAAAFGPRSGEFFGDAARTSQVTRRQFLQNVAIGAALVTLSNCGSQPDAPDTEANAPGSPVPTPQNLEKTDLRIGFIPITCATPIIMSEPLGFYEKYGLKAKVVKLPSWAAVRDSAIAGELDAYHMLSPMPIAMTLGLGSTAFPVKLASIENNNGQGIAVAMQHKDKVKGPADFKGFRIGIPFPFSMHNLLMRYYLATGKVNPDRDVEIQFIPPPDSVAKMAAGQLDAFLMPDNFVQRAVYEKVGFIHLLTKDLWPGHPCCAFTASQQWIDAHPNTFRAVNKAIIDGATYANDPANRGEVAAAISERRYLNQPEEVLQAVFTGKYEDGLGNSFEVPDRILFDPYPWKSFSSWISSQLVRWDLMPAQKADYEQIGEQIFLTDLARDLAKELGQTPPTEATRTEKLKFGAFEPNKAAAYLEQQTKEYGV